MEKSFEIDREFIANLQKLVSITKTYGKKMCFVMHPKTCKERIGLMPGIFPLLVCGYEVKLDERMPTDYPIVIFEHSDSLDKSLANR